MKALNSYPFTNNTKAHPADALLRFILSLPFCSGYSKAYVLKRLRNSTDRFWASGILSLLTKQIL